MFNIILADDAERQINELRNTLSEAQSLGNTAEAAEITAVVVAVEKDIRRRGVKVFIKKGSKVGSRVVLRRASKAI